MRRESWRSMRRMIDKFAQCLVESALAEQVVHRRSRTVACAQLTQACDLWRRPTTWQETVTHWLSVIHVDADSRETAAMRRSLQSDLARAKYHNGLAVNRNFAFFFKLLEHAPNHLSRATDNAGNLLARNTNLGALGVRHSIRFCAQIN
jgi:hypothetical protein